VEAQIPDIKYGYDQAGNRTWMERSDDGRSTYQYDLNYQLIKAVFPSGDSQQFTYDLAGNRNKLVEMKGKKARNTWYEYNAGNEMVKRVQDFNDNQPGPSVVALFAGPGATDPRYITEIAFDGNGSRLAETNTHGPDRQYSWDYRERLLGVKDGNKTIQDNKYDPYNRRVSTLSAGEKTIFIYDASAINNRVMYEYNASGNKPATRNIWLGGQLVSSIEGGNAQHYMADALGSVVAMTNENGVVIQRASYEPFGKADIRGSASDNSIGFVGTLGVRHDAATGNDYMWNRYYENMSGQFISDDALLEYGVVFGPYFSPYKYSFNNPINYYDSLGMMPGAGEWLGLACGGAATACALTGGNPATCGAMAVACGGLLIYEATHIVHSMVNNYRQNACPGYAGRQMP